MFDVVDNGLDRLMTGLRVQVETSDAPVTVYIPKLRVLPNTDIQVSSRKFREDITGKKNCRLFHTNQKVKKLKCCFGHQFGYESRSPFPPTSIIKQSTIKLAQEIMILDGNRMLNSIINVHSEDTLDGATIFKIP
jgi:hypothetical protein